MNLGFSYKLSRKYIALRNPGGGSIEHLAHITRILNEPYTDKLRDVTEYRPLLNNGKPAPAPIIGQPRISVVSGQAMIEVDKWASYQRIFKVKAEKRAIIRIRTYYYPAWHLYVDQKPHPIDISDDGTIELQLESGTYLMELRYQQTGAFRLGIVLSILSIFALALFWIKIPKTRMLVSNKQ